MKVWLSELVEISIKAGPSLCVFRSLKKWIPIAWTSWGWSKVIVKSFFWSLALLELLQFVHLFPWSIFPSIAFCAKSLPCWYEAFAVVFPIWTYCLLIS
ncbi:hypothetical protein NW069_03735 [Mycoplasmopsis cynos]|nr:hypothetical protein [Mycoplasmopsis cynos]MCU9932960.1 hypothetical protein [Mycoplasmopsis cynos]MCU9935376.1 hypothetical protein [Mycoplasmopsis cynos]UWV80415.1 hypothetical protein NW069_03735 [Mycoplasmopsis cynos]UWV86448.1 hypothetical protein NW063_01795 [Mycoplasmopsis cynos]WAM08832.1 hypothetical protein ONA03_00195 [Mycoplasmopsis cynos]